MSPVSTTILDEYESEAVADYAMHRMHTSHIASPTYMFCQGIVQEVLSNEVTSDQAKTLHGAIGMALEVSYAEAAQAHAAELAPHFVLSGEKKARYDGVYWLAKMHHAYRHIEKSSAIFVWRSS